MICADRILHRKVSTILRPAGGSPFRIEPLERRRLLAFSTVDTVPDFEVWGGIAADGLGNVYYSGVDYSQAADVSESSAVVRQGSNGGTTWENILEVPYEPGTPFGPEVWGLAANPAGDLYAGIYQTNGPWQILQRPAGDTQFYEVHNSSTGSLNQFDSLSVDPDGTAYAITYTAVLRQNGTLGPFSTVDLFPANHTLTAISATEHGVYAVGNRQIRSGKGANATTTFHWIVRKSLTGNPGTWSTVDDFQLDEVNNLRSAAELINVEADGTIRVAGYGDEKVRTGGTNKKPIYTTFRRQLVRTSTDDGASWATEVVWSGSNSTTNFNSITTDAVGNVYLTANENGIDSVRMKAAGGTTWTTIDQFTGESLVTTDSDGNVYVAGTVFGPEAAPHDLYSYVRMQPAAALFSSVPISGETGDGGESSSDDSSLVDDLLGLGV